MLDEEWFDEECFSSADRIEGPNATVDVKAKLLTLL
jgi:hypothetical protein